MLKQVLAIILMLAAGNIYADEMVSDSDTDTNMQAVIQPVAEPKLEEPKLDSESMKTLANSPIHQELRGLLQGIETAINTEKYGDLKQYFDVKLHVTTINQNVITTPEGIDAYFKEWFGEGGYLKKLDIQLNADELTQLYGDPANPNWGLVYGNGVEKYKLTDGRDLDMKTRWTATVTKGDDGKWRIMALHIGTNFYDNPIFLAVKDATQYYAAGGLLIGLLLGALGMAFLRRKKH